MFVFLYLLVTIIFFLVVLILTFGSSGWGYVSVDSIVANLNNNFLIGLYVALPAVTVFLVTVATKNHTFAVYNWYIAVGIAGVRLGILLITNRWNMVRKFPWLLVTTASVILSYFACQAVINDNSTLSLASPGLCIVVMWFVTVLVIAKLLASAQFGNLDEDSAYRANIQRLYVKHRKQFDKYIGKSFRNDEVAYRVLFAIMIAEDVNRPGVIRLVERMLFPFNKVATTGIMQVTASEYLSNQKSVVVAQEIIYGSYGRHRKQIKEEYSLVRAVAEDYNGGVYPELVADIYFMLKEHNYNYTSTKRSK